MRLSEARERVWASNWTRARWNCSWRHSAARAGPDVASRMLAHPAGLADVEIIQDMISIIAA